MQRKNPACVPELHIATIMSVAPPGTQNVKKNVRKIAGDYLTVCDLVLHAEHVSLQM